MDPDKFFAPIGFVAVVVLLIIVTFLATAKVAGPTQDDMASSFCIGQGFDNGHYDSAEGEIICSEETIFNADQVYWRYDRPVLQGSDDGISR